MQVARVLGLPPSIKRELVDWQSNQCSQREDEQVWLWHLSGSEFEIEPFSARDFSRYLVDFRVLYSFPTHRQAYLASHVQYGIH